MSINLMDLAKGAIGKQVLRQLGGILGASDEKTQTGIDAVLPAILGVLMKKATTKEGANEIFRQVGEQDDSILDNLGDLLGGAGKSGLLSGGLAIAKMLFGSKFDKLGGVLGNKTGMGGGAISQLISFLIPVVMSILSRQKKSQGWDAMGMANMLGEQKQHLGNSLTGDLTDALGIGDLFSGASAAVTGAGQAVTGAARDTGAAVGRAADAVGSGARDVADAGGSLIGKLLPLIGVLALALLAWMFFKDSTQSKETVPTNEAIVVEDDLSAPVVPSDTMRDVQNRSTQTMDAATEAMETVTEMPGELHGAAVDAIEGVGAAMEETGDAAADLLDDAANAIPNN